jgi:hypothetical protein
MALEGREGSASRPGRSLLPGKDTVPIVKEAGWAPGPVCTGAENLAPPLGFDSRNVQVVASRYTDWAPDPPSVGKPHVKHCKITWGSELDIEPVTTESHVECDSTRYRLGLSYSLWLIQWIYRRPQVHCVRMWSDNKVRELIAVKVLHISLLNNTVVAFKVLPLGSYAPMPAPSPPF